MLNRISSQLIPWEIQNKLDLFFGDLREVGVSYIGHGVVSDGGHHTGYFSNENWGRFYIENRYFFSEPILTNYEKKHLDLIPWLSVEDRHSIVRVRNEYINVNSGMTVCKKEGEFNTFFNIGFKEGIDIIDFCFFKRDLLLAYFTIFNNYHLMWRKNQSIDKS